MSADLSRRRMLIATGHALAAAVLGVAPGASSARPQDASDGRLTARPRRGAATSLTSGPLGLGRGTRDGVVQMPGELPTGPLPLLIFLHGATGNGAGALRRIASAADRAGIVVVAPDSRNGTWDAIRGDGFGEDLEYLDRVLGHVLARVNVDPTRLAIGGFSDGASYALSLGLANGDLFPRVIGCSPGFIARAPAHGQPEVFISHGTSDQILNIDRCSRVIVPTMRAAGYRVEYREFDGRHELPPAIADEALAWLTKR